MPSSSVVIILSAIFTLTNAMPWSGPNPTASYNPADIAPQPTSAPELRSRFLRRANVPSNTCGWANGDVNQPTLCGGNSFCVWDIARGVVGCCPGTGSCTNGIATRCVDSSNAQPSVLNANVLTCGGGNVCYQDTYGQGFYQYGCGASTDAASVATTFSGMGSSQRLTIIYTSLALETTPGTLTRSTMSSASPTSVNFISIDQISSSLTTTSSSSSPSSSSSSSTASSSSSSSSSSSISSSTSSISTADLSSSTMLPTGIQAIITPSSAADVASSISPGVIAGAVIGGLAVAAMIFALIAFLLYRRQKKRHQGGGRDSQMSGKGSLFSSSFRPSSSFSTVHPAHRIQGVSISAPFDARTTNTNTNTHDISNSLASESSLLVPENQTNTASRSVTPPTVIPMSVAIASGSNEHVLSPSQFRNASFSAASLHTSPLQHVISPVSAQSSTSSATPSAPRRQLSRMSQLTVRRTGEYSPSNYSEVPPYEEEDNFYLHSNNHRANIAANANEAATIEEQDQPESALSELGAAWVRPPTPPPRSPKRLERQSQAARASLLGENRSYEGSQDSSQRNRGSSFSSEAEELDLGEIHLLRKQAERELAEEEEFGGYTKGELGGLLRVRDSLAMNESGYGGGNGNARRIRSGEVEIKPLRLSQRTERYSDTSRSMRRKKVPGVPILGIPNPSQGRGGMTYDV